MHKVWCFSTLDDTQEPAKFYSCKDYVVTTNSARDHELVLDPNDLHKAVRLHVKEGERNLAQPLRFARIVIGRDDGAVKNYAVDGSSEPPRHDEALQVPTQEQSSTTQDGEKGE